MLFRDRRDAGRRLVERVADLHLSSPIVLALPRGGVPVAAEIAAALHAPLDVFVARKIGLPGHQEFGIGAVAEGAFAPVRSDVVDDLGIADDQFEQLALAERAEVDRRVHRYRHGRPLPDVRGRDVLLVDDGLATGVTAEAAMRSLLAMHPSRLLFAAPVCAGDAAQRLRRLAPIVCVETPPDFVAVGRWYEDFRATTDDEVMSLLAPDRPSIDAVSIPVGDGVIRGDLSLGARARGLVVFAHGSGSSRMSPRNRRVAQRLQDAGFATLLLDLLTEAEERIDVETRALRFDIALLAERLIAAVAWVDRERAVAIPVGYFGASTGAGAALLAASRQGPRIDAVVSRGGRPDLAGDALGRVHAPTLLIVGGRDTEVVELNRSAGRKLRGLCRLAIVPGATHLFEESGALEQVADMAADWFGAHLGAAHGVTDIPRSA